MKKLGFALVVALFGFSVLVTACKKQEAPAPAPAPAEQQPAPAAPADQAAPAQPGAPAEQPATPMAPTKQQGLSTRRKDPGGPDGLSRPVRRFYFSLFGNICMPFNPSPNRRASWMREASS